MRFKDREQAGQLLAVELELYKHPVVYGLPRGGVVVAAEVARHLDAPLDLLIPRKIAFPGHPEFAVCAVSEHRQLVCDDAADVIDPDWLTREVDRQLAEARRRRERYLADRQPVPVEGKTAIIVDDGIATGLTMLAAILEVRERRPSDIVVAVPVLPAEVARYLEGQGINVVAMEVAEHFAGAVAAYYEHFEQVADEEVVSILNSLRTTQHGRSN